MHLTLEVKRYHEFFWLRDIRGVDISKCCAECFLGGKDNRVYYGTLHKPTALVDIDVIEHPKAVAYYLCGLSAGFNYWQNTHIDLHPPAENLPQLDLRKLHQRWNVEEVSKNGNAGNHRAG